MMYPTLAMPQLTCLTPQMFSSLLELMQQFQRNGMLKAAADLANVLGQCSLSSLPPSPSPCHVCPLNFPPPQSQSSPRKRRRQQRRKSSTPASRSNLTWSPSSPLTAINGRLPLQQFRGFDIALMSATIDRLAPANHYLPHKSASTPPLSQRSCWSPPASFKRAKADVIAKAKEEVFEEQMSNKLVGDEVSLEQAEVEEAIANEVDQSITYKEEGVSKPLAAKDDLGEAPEEELGLHTAFQGELIDLMPRVEEPVVAKEVEVTDAMKVEEEAIINQGANEVEEIITAKQEEEVNEDKVSFSMEDLEYDDATGQLLIHLEDGVVEVSDLQARDQLLAKMSSVPHDDQLLANMFPAPKARAAPILSHVPDVEEEVLGIPPVPPKPINFRLQEERLTYGHLGQAKAQSLGRWTSWTRDLLISDLEASFTKPRRGIFWSDFSPEERLACFDMVDWGATYPLDPPPRSLMFEPDEDQWSTWA